MAMDGGFGLPHSAFVGLAEAVDLALGNRSRAWLAERLTTDRSTVSRWLSGDIPVRVDQVVAMERALGVQPGLLFRAMGVIEDAQTFDGWLEGQPRLSAQTRSALRAAFHAAQG